MHEVCCCVRWSRSSRSQLLLMVQTAEFKQWYEDNQSWVQPYSAFCFLRDLFGSAEHWKWGSLSQPSQQVCSEIVVLAAQLKLMLHTTPQACCQT